MAMNEIDIQVGKPPIVRAAFAGVFVLLWALTSMGSVRFVLFSALTSVTAGWVVDILLCTFKSDSVSR